MPPAYQGTFDIKTGSGTGRAVDTGSTEDEGSCPGGEAEEKHSVGSGAKDPKSQFIADEVHGKSNGINRLIIATDMVPQRSGQHVRFTYGRSWVRAPVGPRSRVYGHASPNKPDVDLGS